MKRPGRLPHITALPLLSALALLPLHAVAAPLDKNTCARLGQEMLNLKALDVDRLMANGPAWAASNLSSGDLALVRQYIDLDEQIKFRCAPPGSLVRLKHLEDDEDDTGPKRADDASGAKPGAQAKPARPIASGAPAKKRPSDANLTGSRQ